MGSLHVYRLHILCSKLLLSSFIGVSACVAVELVLSAWLIQRLNRALRLRVFDKTTPHYDCSEELMKKYNPDCAMTYLVWTRGLFPTESRGTEHGSFSTLEGRNE